MNRTSVLRLVIFLVVIPVLVSAFCTYSLWGYAFTPPSVEALAAGTWLDRIAYVEYTWTEAEGERLWRPHNAHPGEYLYRYDMPPLEIHRYAQTHGAPFLSPADDQTLASLHQAVRVLGWNLYRADDPDRLFPGYVRAFVASGQRDGAPLVLVGITSMPLDWLEGEARGDDTYNAYHGLFERDTDGTFRLIAQQHYRYDSAGIEFAQFPFWLASIYLLYGIAYPVLGIIRVLREGRRKRKSRAERLPDGEREPLVALLGDDGELQLPPESAAGIVHDAHRANASEFSDVSQVFTTNL